MSRTALFNKKDIYSKALQIVREQGSESLSARTLCRALGCSVSPLFTLYKNMEEICADTRAEANRVFADYVKDVNEYEPAFKEFGLRLVRFAREEPNLFHYLFLEKGAVCDSAGVKAGECLQAISEEYSLDKAQTEMLFGQMWPFACGVALLCCSNPDIYTEEHVSEMLSIQFTSILSLIKSGRAVLNITPAHYNISNNEK